MGRDEDRNKREKFEEKLQGKSIPVLTLDNKWYRLLGDDGRKEVKGMEEQLNALLKRQGKVTTEAKDIRKLKKKLMHEIVVMVDEASQSQDKALEKKIEQNKRLVEECSEKLEAYREEEMELPGEIERLNRKLMLYTMERCYAQMRENTKEIQSISEWVSQIRIQLKKNLIRKQEMERKNQEIYSYMHDLFGADVVDMFDMEYGQKEN